ncbi:hypothetical protein Tco_1392021, partial [Tanacetum coccineum]
EANFKTLESLMKDYRRQARDEGLQRELEYSSEDYDKEIKAEPRPRSIEQAHPTLRIGSSVIPRTNRRTIWFKGISERAPNVNLPPLLAAHLGRKEAGAPLQPSMAFGLHFIQQKKFTKTHLIVHNIKQKEGETTRAFVTAPYPTKKPHNIAYTLSGTKLDTEF